MPGMAAVARGDDDAAVGLIAVPDTWIRQIHARHVLSTPTSRSPSRRPSSGREGAVTFYRKGDGRPNAAGL